MSEQQRIADVPEAEQISPSYGEAGQAPFQQTAEFPANRPPEQSGEQTTAPTPDAASGNKTDHKRQRRTSPEQKARAVLRVFGGESKEKVAADLGVSLDRVDRWITTFYDAGADALARATSSSSSSSRKTRGEKTKARTGGTLNRWILGLVVLLVAIGILVWLLTPA